MGHENFWLKKKFGIRKNLGPEEILLPKKLGLKNLHLPDTFQTHSRHLPNTHPFTLTPIDQFCKVKLGVVLVVVVVVVVVVTLENKVNSEPDLFKFVQVRSGWVPSRVGV